MQHPNGSHPRSGKPQRFALGRQASTLVTAVAWIAALTPSAAAQAGDLDPTFGANGIVTTDIWGSTIGDTDQLQDFTIACQADGKIVAVGRTRNTDDGEYVFGVVRYLADGSLDSSFGGDGIVTSDFGSGQEQATAVAVQPDGKLVVAGGAFPGRLLIARYLPDGTLDTTFDGDGWLEADLSSGSDRARAVALEADGDIVVALTIAGPNFGVARFTTDGILDTTFDLDGLAVAGLDTFASVGSMVLQADGDILVAGYSGPFPDTAITVVRFDTDGALDPGFGTSGVALTNIGTGTDTAHGMTLQVDGRILVVGKTDAGGNDDFAVLRYQTDGTLDGTFGSGGVMTTDVAASSQDTARGVAYQFDGRIVVVGSATPNGQSCEAMDFALARYNSDGTLDSTFGMAGLVTTDVGGYRDSAQDVAIQADGRILVGGWAQNAFVGSCGPSALHPLDFALARYEGVLQPLPILENTIEQVEALVPTIGEGQGNSLCVKLQGAIQSIDAGKEIPAINRLEAFINATEALIDSGQLDVTEGDVLIAHASAVIAALGA